VKLLKLEPEERLGAKNI